MKYIRTKDKISGERIYENDIPEPKNEHEKETLQKLRDNIGEIIINQADTIEELCDGFYLDNDENEFIMNFYHHWWGGDNFVCDKDSYYVFNRNDFKKLKESFYGYIKTDKGLIYVAKMNDKGELELI